MTAVIYEKETGQILKYFDTLRGAKICFTKKWKINGEQQLYVVCSVEDYEKTGGVKASEMVTVRSIMGKDVEIRGDQVGSCCDPSTERYWSM